MPPPPTRTIDDLPSFEVLGAVFTDAALGMFRVLNPDNQVVRLELLRRLAHGFELTRNGLVRALETLERADAGDDAARGEIERALLAVFPTKGTPS